MPRLISQVDFLTFLSNLPGLLSSRLARLSAKRNSAPLAQDVAAGSALLPLQAPLTVTPCDLRHDTLCILKDLIFRREFDIQDNRTQPPALVVNPH